MACPVQKYPLKRPPNWKPPVPRWQLALPKDVTHIYTLYIGVQKHRSSPAFDTAIASIESWMSSPTVKPAAHDSFATEVELAHDIPGSRVWVCSWTDRSSFDSAIADLDLMSKWRALGNSGEDVGLWTESMVTPVERLETNYAGLHEKPGLASLPDTTREEHTVSAYWGAARDRIPASREDLYPVPGTTTPEYTDGQYNHKDPKSHPHEQLDTHSSAPEVQPPDPIPKGFGQRLVGSSYDNMCHIRSGQCWEQCPPDEAQAYEEKLQKSLMKGMEYIWTEAHETGCLGLRWLRNVVPTETSSTNGHANGNTNGNNTTTTTNSPVKVKTINETCGAGFFRNLRDLEIWSSSHPTHKAIFAGAHKHARDWGKDRKFMTWHEVSVLKKGEARWEYVNCDPRTGVIRGLRMETVESLEV